MYLLTFFKLLQAYLNILEYRRKWHEAPVAKWEHSGNKCMLAGCCKNRPISSDQEFNRWWKPFVLISVGRLLLACITLRHHDTLYVKDRVYNSVFSGSQEANGLDSIHKFQIWTLKAPKNQASSSDHRVIFAGSQVVRFPWDQGK